MTSKRIRTEKQSWTPGKKVEFTIGSSGGPTSQSTPGKKVEFTIGSEPDSPGRRYTKQPREGFGEFLRTCYLCNKNLEGEKVFMYGDLRGFCSIDCRELQMDYDGFPPPVRKLEVKQGR